MKKIIKILILLAVILSVLLVVTCQSNKEEELKVYFFDVGQGDGILIRTPSQQNIIIDGGPDNSFITKLGQTLPFYDKTIDLMVLTHPHDDHLFGLVEVLKRYQVKRVLYSGALHTTDAYLEWLSIIKEKKVPLTIAQAGQKFVFNDIRLTVIFPFENLANQSFENLNDSSVVIQLIYDKTKILFMGDLESDGESKIIQHQPSNIQSQVIKIGHHGSSNASFIEFLKQVSPNYAIISVGRENKFGQPSLRTLSRLRNRKIEIFRTDQQSDIFLKSNGQKITLIPARP